MSCGYAAKGYTCDAETDEGGFNKTEVYVNDGLLIGVTAPPTGIVDINVVYTERFGEPGLVPRAYEGFSS